MQVRTHFNPWKKYAQPWVHIDPTCLAYPLLTGIGWSMACRKQAIRYIWQHHRDQAVGHMQSLCIKANLAVMQALQTQIDGIEKALATYCRSPPAFPLLKSVTGVGQEQCFQWSAASHKAWQRSVSQASGLENEPPYLIGH